MIIDSFLYKIFQLTPEEERGEFQNICPNIEFQCISFDPKVGNIMMSLPKKLKFSDIKKLVTLNYIIFKL